MRFFTLPVAVLITILSTISHVEGTSPTSVPSTMPSIAPSSEPITMTPSVEPSTAPSKAPVAPVTSAPVAPVTSAPAAPVLTDELPGIYCISNQFNPDYAEDNLACPDVVDIVATSVGHSLNILTYQKSWLDVTEQSVYPDTIKNETVTEIDANGTLINTTEVVIKPLLGACGFDCDNNDHCAPGLLCAQGNRLALRQRGLHTRKANCNRRLSGAPNDDVCFRAKLLDERPIIADRVLQQLFDDADDTDDEEEEDEVYRHRQLQCPGKCSPQCRQRPRPQYCVYLGCGGCRRRRSRGRRSLQQVNVTELATLATSKLRELATWTNLTDADPRCKTFLETAVCSAETLEIR